MQAIGIILQNGYGLTETSPVVCARTLSYNVSHSFYFLIDFWTLNALNFKVSFWFFLAKQSYHLWLIYTQKLTSIIPLTKSFFFQAKVLGSAGHPMHGTEFKIVDPETNNVLPPGSKGIVKVRGPQIMKGYYKVVIVLWTYF